VQPSMWSSARKARRADASGASCSRCRCPWATCTTAREAVPVAIVRFSSLVWFVAYWEERDRHPGCHDGEADNPSHAVYVGFRRRDRGGERLGEPHAERDDNDDADRDAIARIATNGLTSS
jgi:hypothetical protein